MAIQQGHTGEHEFPLWQFSSAFILSILITVYIGWTSWRMHQRFEKAAETHIAISESIGRMLLYDEVLTMSAKLAAATGDFSNEKRYDQFDLQLIAEINTLKTMLKPEETEQFVAETDAANLALVKMERQAFEFTHQGRQQEAIALLTSDEYLKKKAAYSEGTAKAIKAVKVHISKEDNDLHVRSVILIVVGAASILILITIWVITYRAVQRWARKRREFQDALQSANTELESRVEQRTAELSSSNNKLLAEISGRQKIQTELIHNQDLLNEAQRLGKLGNWEVDLQTGRMTWSEEVFRIVELDPAVTSPSYEKLIDVIHPDDRDMVKQAYRESLEKRQPYELDHRLLFPDGRIKWVRRYCASYFDESGRPLRSGGAVQDITSQKEAEEEIRSLAFYDPLTKLPNRRLFNDRLDQRMAASNRSGRYGAVMFLDLDNFKTLNDTQGHDAGDLLLIEVACRIKKCLRTLDTVARFGGDEFAVLISELDEDKAGSSAKAGIVAEKIRSALAEPYLLKIQRESKAETAVEHRCSSSIGVTLFLNHKSSQETILKNADIAMYQAKKGGRNMVSFFDS